MEKRVADLEKEVVLLKKELLDIKQLLNIQLEAEERPWETNTVSDWMIKLVYPGIYVQKDKPAAGFPQNRRKTAVQIKPGQMMFIYATSPVKKIIGLTKVVSTMKVLEGRWPYSVDLEWVIGPKQEGVSLEECGLNIRPRPGDTVYGINEDVAQEIVGLLDEQDDLTPDQWDLLARQYKELYKEAVSFDEAVRRLRDAGEDEAADALESFYAVDGTRRGWDEMVSKGQFHRTYPNARSTIWPNTYND